MTLARILAVVGVAAGALVAQAQLSIAKLLPSPGLSQTWAGGVSADGSTQVGFSWDGVSPQSKVATTWLAANSPVSLAKGTFVSTMALACSSDGKVVLGSASDTLNRDHVVWWDTAGIHDQALGSPVGISTGARTFVYQSASTAYLVHDGSTFQLKPLQTSKPVVVTGVAPDGNSAVGYTWVTRADTPDFAGDTSRGATDLPIAVSWALNGVATPVDTASYEFNTTTGTWTSSSSQAIGTAKGVTYVVRRVERKSQGVTTYATDVLVALPAQTELAWANLLKSEALTAPLALTANNVALAVGRSSDLFGTRGATLMPPSAKWRLTLDALYQQVNLRPEGALDWDRATIPGLSQTGTRLALNAAPVGSQQSNGYAASLNLLPAPDTFSITPGSSWNSPTISLLDNDYLDPYATAALVAAPTHGALNLRTDGTFSYVPDLGFYGKDTFTYKAVSTFGTTSPVSVSLVVGSVRSVSSNPASTYGGDPAPLQVTVSLDFVPTKNQSVALTTDHPEALSLPAAVTVQANSASVTFSVATKAVSSTLPVTIAAAVFGKRISTTVTLLSQGSKTAMVRSAGNGDIPLSKL